MHLSLKESFKDVNNRNLTSIETRVNSTTSELVPVDNQNLIPYTEDYYSSHLE